LEKGIDPIERAIKEVPDYRVFLTVEELDESSRKLAEESPELVKSLEIGRSREGRPIYALKIGKGRRKALLFGCPHPNEPIGAMMLEYLSRRLVEDEELREALDYTWYIVKVADPDGLKLNEGWLKGPFTPLNYARNYYRPAGNQQVEWTFPINYKTLKFNNPIPETRALMRLIEDVKPDFIYSLHNAGFGGVYFYISSKAPLLYPIFHWIVKSQELPLSLGEPEMPYAVELSEAVYYMPSIKDEYDYLEKTLKKDPAEVIRTGTSSVDYARNFNPEVFELVTEVPYYYDPRIEDTSSTDVIRRDAILHSISEARKIYGLLEEKYNSLKDGLKLSNRIREAIEYFLKVMPDHLKAHENWARTEPSLSRKATVAELFDNYQVSKFYRLLMVGMFIRMLKAEEAEGNTKVSKVREELEDFLEEEGKRLEKELNYRVIPIKKLVATQLAAGLYSALYVQVRLECPLKPR